MLLLFIHHGNWRVFKLWMKKNQFKDFPLTMGCLFFFFFFVHHFGRLLFVLTVRPVCLNEEQNCFLRSLQVSEVHSLQVLLRRSHADIHGGSIKTCQNKSPSEHVGFIADLRSALSTFHYQVMTLKNTSSLWTRLLPLQVMKGVYHVVLTQKVSVAAVFSVFTPFCIFSVIVISSFFENEK